MSGISMYADRVFKNGRIVTVDEKDSVCSALAVKGRYILCVGEPENMASLIGPDTEVIDLKGRTMTPGFIDAHCHPILSGLMGDVIKDIYYPGVKSIRQIKEIIAQEAKKVPEGTWIKLWGYDANKVEEKRHVTIEDLDEAAPNHPVQCLQASGHLIVYNSLAFRMAGITAEDRKGFKDDEIIVENGKLTGMTQDLGAFYLWSKVGYTREEMQIALDKMNRELLAFGVTSVHDPGEFDAPSYRMMQESCRNRSFKPRVYEMLHSVYGKPFSRKDVDDFIGLGLVSGLGDEYFRFGTCKFMIDGGTSGPSSLMRENYSHEPEKNGVMSFTQDEVDELIAKIHDAGCQASAHAVGDAAVDMMLEGYENAQKANYRPPEEHRHRIEHCAFADHETIKRLKEMGIIPAVNPAFLTIHGSNYNKFYGERTQRFAALRDMIDAGVRACITSDSPSADANVMRGIDAAVNRRDWQSGEYVGKNQAVSVLEAIRCYTINPAYASFEEKIKGSLEPGKLADMVIFDRDILSCPKEELRDVKVDVTIMDGKDVYVREG